MNMSSESQRPSNVVQAPYAPLASRPPHPFPKAILALVCAVVAVLLAVFVVLVAVLGGNGSSSPAAAFTSYVNGINSGNVKMALDHTTVKFASDYQQQITERQSGLLMGDPTITVKSLTTVYNVSMSENQRARANDMLYTLRSSENITVTDFAFVDYTITIAYATYGSSNTFNGEMLCVEVDGGWYMVMLTRSTD
jgi:hypothetical protein